MREVNYLKNKFQYAVNGNGTFRVTQNDINAINQIVDFANTNYKNTQLEDALLLFYLLQNWKVENENNENLSMVIQEYKDKGIFQLTDSMKLFERIGMLINPKEEMIKQITVELQAHQKMNGVTKEKYIRLRDVAQLLEEELKKAKNNFIFLKQLNSDKPLRFAYPTTKNKLGV